MVFSGKFTGEIFQEGSQVVGREGFAQVNEYVTMGITCLWLTQALQEEVGEDEAVPRISRLCSSVRSQSGPCQGRRSINTEKLGQKTSFKTSSMQLFLPLSTPLSAYGKYRSQRLPASHVNPGHSRSWRNSRMPQPNFERPARSNQRP